MKTGAVYTFRPRPTSLFVVLTSEDHNRSAAKFFAAPLLATPDGADIQGGGLRTLTPLPAYIVPLAGAYFHHNIVGEHEGEAEPAAVRRAISICVNSFPRFSG